MKKKEYKSVRLRKDTYEGIFGMKAEGVSIDAAIRKRFRMPPRRYD
jgi:hypothetical protein